MPDVQLSQVQVQGFDALHLHNRLISLTIVPELGGKLSSIRDLRIGREWLWTSASIPYRRVPYGTSYIGEADTGGWDECFPTVAPCTYPSDPWGGLLLPDHGEVWPQAWTLHTDHDGNGAITLHTEAQGVRLPYTFRRSICMEPNSATLRFDYLVQNRADAEIQFIWSAHPLFAIEPGMRVLLPESAHLRPYIIVPPELRIDQQGANWPLHLDHQGRKLDLTTLPDVDTAIAFKLWSEPLAEGTAALVADDGEFHFRWDTTLVPQVGLWLNAGGWSGTGGEPYYNLALEPCIGAQDSLEEAINRYGYYQSLPVDGKCTWWLEVILA